MKNNSISFINFSKNFGTLKVFKNFNCSFVNNKINAIMGPSGSGKTTLLNAIAGLINYDGVVEFDGIEHVNKCNVSVSYVFQEPRLIPQKTVLKNLDFALKNVIENKLERREKIEKMLKDVGLEDVLNKYPQSLSGGMAGRVAICRAFLYPSKILLMDEPFKGLDTDTKNKVTETFLTLFKQDPRTTIFVTHNKTEADMLADNVYLFSDKPISACTASPSTI